MDEEEIYDVMHKAHKISFKTVSLANLRGPQWTKRKYMISSIRLTRFLSKQYLLPNSANQKSVDSKSVTKYILKPGPGVFLGNVVKTPPFI